MKIVVLDGYTLNPGDLSWANLEALGSTKVHERTDEESLQGRIDGAEIVLTNKTPLQRETIRKFTSCRYIGLLSTGYNVVNVEAASKKGIVVTNVPGYATAAVTERVFGFLFEFAQSVSFHAHTVRQGRWNRCPDFCYTARPMFQYAGRTMGIVGYGETGQAVARAAAAFGMPLRIHTRRPPDVLPGPGACVDLETLFRESDVISLHCPLSPATDKMVNEYRLSLMKPTAILINCARGALVDETALAQALKAERIAGAGLDVLEVEPPKLRNPLLELRNCLVTPHNAWATREARQKLMDEVVENVRAFLAGEPRNIIRPPRTEADPEAR